jgi:transposase
MKKRKKKKFTGKSSEKTCLRKVVFTYSHPQIQRKCLAVLLLMFLFNASLVGRILGLSGVCVKNYWKAYKSGGVQALQKLRYKGNPSSLATHGKSIEEDFEKDPPHTAAEAVARIEKLTGIKRSLKSIRSFLKSIDFRYRKASQIPAKADREKQKNFLDNFLHPRLKEVVEGTRDLLFMDAAHFVHGAFLGCLWSKVRVWVKAPSGRKRLNVLGAVNAITKQVHTYCNETYINSHVVCDFIKEMAKAYMGKSLSIVLDNARYQRCKMVTEMANSLNVELLFLPSYSPNLNLIERLWKFIKKKSLNSRYYATFTDFQAAILKALDCCNEEWRLEMESLLTLEFQTFPEEKINIA